MIPMASTHPESRACCRRVALLLGLVGLQVACTSAGPGSPATGLKQPASEQPVTIVARDLAFNPSAFSLTAGQTVRLTLVNEGALEHDLTIPGVVASGEVTQAHGQREMGHGMAAPLPPGTVHLSAHPGEQASLEVTPKPGTYEYFCSVAGHREAGMRGTLTVQ